MDVNDVSAGTEPPAGRALLFDEETGLLGPEAWALLLAAELARCRRFGRIATVVVVEVARLEGLSAVWGEDAGAHASARVGAALRARSRASDYAARIGPRRFAILLPETDEVAAVNFVERVRAFCDHVLQAAESGAYARFGWADATGSRSLVAAADAALARLAEDRVAVDGE